MTKTFNFHSQFYRLLYSITLGTIMHEYAKNKHCCLCVIAQDFMQYVPKNIAIFCKEAISFCIGDMQKNPHADATNITEMQALNCLGLERNWSKNGTIFSLLRPLLTHCPSTLRKHFTNPCSHINGIVQRRVAPAV